MMPGAVPMLVVMDVCRFRRKLVREPSAAYSTWLDLASVELAEATGRASSGRPRGAEHAAREDGDAECRLPGAAREQAEDDGEAEPHSS